VKQVSRELGVRYVVEGSVRKAGDRLRVSAQLIDATTGHHVWAERYDRRFEDVFALQDEITKAIAGSMHPRLLQSDSQHAARKRPQNLQAWDYAQKAWWHWHLTTKEDNSQARVLCEKAIELDPSLVWAFTGLASMHYCDLFFQWSDAPHESVRALVQAAERCVALDDEDAFSHLVMSLAYSVMGQQDKAIAAAELAIELNPSLPLAHHVLGSWLAFSARPDDAITHLEKAIRLSPHDPWMYDFLCGMALAHFAARRYEEAAEWAQRSLQRRLDYVLSRSILAASCAHLGRTDEARTALAAAMHLQQGSFEETAKLALPFADPDLVERVIDGLRKAGFKE
jgi:adenylate cyclase